MNEDLQRLKRAEMVRLIQARGVTDVRVLQALTKVPRERFVPPDWQARAYEDSPLPIAAGQTISQPYMVALMAAALELTQDDRVLEIGTGSGYAAAILGELAQEVHTLERQGELAITAARRLEELGYWNVHVHYADGTLGWPASAPYDAICVAAAGPGVPQALVDQLAEGGRLVLPVGDEEQRLLRIRKRAGQLSSEVLADVRFVPLLGAVT